jgi:hypothetical protein
LAQQSFDGAIITRWAIFEEFKVQIKRKIFVVVRMCGADISTINGYFSFQQFMTGLITNNVCHETIFVMK